MPMRLLIYSALTSALGFLRNPSRAFIIDALSRKRGGFYAWTRSKGRNRIVCKLRAGSWLWAILNLDVMKCSFLKSTCLSAFFGPITRKIWSIIASAFVGEFDAGFRESHFLFRSFLECHKNIFLFNIVRLSNYFRDEREEIFLIKLLIFFFFENTRMLV